MSVKEKHEDVLRKTKESTDEFHYLKRQTTIKVHIKDRSVLLAVFTTYGGMPYCLGSLVNLFLKN